jgi:flavin-dependent dehydrogenase
VHERREGLAEQAVRAGATLRLTTPGQDVAVAADGVIVLTPGGPVRARACVLACGVAYRFQRQLGLGLPGQAIHTAQVDVQALVRRTPRFNWHRDLIVALARHPGVTTLLFRTLFR